MDEVIPNTSTLSFEQIFKQENGIFGIKNSGCSCYLNSIIQCLSKTVPFSKIFINDDMDDTKSWIRNINETEDKKFVKEFNTLIKVLWNIERENEDEDDSSLKFINTKDNKVYNSINIRGLELIIKQKYPYLFEPPFQQDSSEVLIYLLESIHNGMSREVEMSIASITPKNKLEKLTIESHKSFINFFQKDYSPIIDLFYGSNISTIRVNDSNIESNTYDMCSMFPLIIPDLEPKENENFPRCSFDDCFKETQIAENLDGENQWYHEGTDKKYDATKQIKIFKPPKILVLHIKRYGFLKKKDENGKEIMDYNFPIKNNTLINFPFDLNITPYIYHKDCVLDKRDCLYELYATSNHKGNPQNGHFFANCKIEDKWYTYDDEDVQEIDDQQIIINNRALVLFYKRKDL